MLPCNFMQEEKIGIWVLTSFVKQFLTSFWEVSHEYKHLNTYSWQLYVKLAEYWKKKKFKSQLIHWEKQDQCRNLLSLTLGLIFL